jgi:hypothetical protein
VWCGQSAAKDPVAAAVLTVNRCYDEGVQVQPSTLTDLSATLCAFLEGEATARDQLPRMLKRDLERLAGAIASDDLRRRSLVPDVIGRTWELLLRRGPGSFDPSRGTALAYVASIVRTACRDVRQQNSFELRRSRDYSGETESLPVASRTPQAIMDVVAVSDLLARAFGDDTEAQTAARLIAFYDATLSTAAEAVGVSRFVLKRRLSLWSAGKHLLVA